MLHSHCYCSSPPNGHMYPFSLFQNCPCLDYSFPSIPTDQRPPSLPTLTCFKTSSGSINVAERIGAQYLTFGLQLLEDATGAITKAIEEECHHNAYKINLEILMKWIGGQGRRPLSWATLIKVLKDIQLSELAREIEHNL